MPVLLLLSCARIAAIRANDAPLAEFDFRAASQVARWQAAHDVAPLVATEQGLKITITGDDPYLLGPAIDFPPQVPLVMTMRIRAEQGGMGQLFWFQEHAREAASTRFAIPRGGPHNVTIHIPPLDRGFRFRFDPPGGNPAVVLERIEVRPRLVLTPPAWPSPTVPRPVATAPRIASGPLSLILADDGAEDSLLLLWRDHPLATGHNRPWLGYLLNGQPRWLDRRASTTSSRAQKVGLGGQTVTEWTDADGGQWRLTRQFAPEGDQAIEVRVSVVVDQPRDVTYFPLLVLLAGHGEAAPARGQGLLAGVEYLDDEPSSSTADLEGPGALRRVPHLDKLTFPLMAVEQGKHYVGLIWHPNADVAPLFDRPDRIYGTQADVLGLIAPGANAASRVDGELLPVAPLRIGPDRPLTMRATILAGDGPSLVPAIQTYVRRRGMPPVPPLPARGEYVRLAAQGWLDTEIHDDGLFRHAVGNGFHPQPAADAAWMLGWLAAVTDDAALRERLESAARRATERVPAGNEFHAAVGHLRPPVAGLITPRTAATLEQARHAAEAALQQFDEDGVARYHPPAKGLDYSRTNPTREASGLAARAVAQLLQAAAYAGDGKLVTAGLHRLRKLDRYGLGVPRGAQTWEIPLHTPDILASAHLVHAYLLGYELTGERQFLERALYWAWTGVPFVYLRKPYDGAVGDYATIPVLGATQWHAPIWIGLPVQWCGLVYAFHIDRLARHDPRGPWKQLVAGITASALQQVYPADHPRRGLLPDSFQLQLQVRQPADINPGTLQPLAMRLLTDIPVYDYRAARGPGWLIHVPGSIDSLTELPAGSGVDLTVRTWSADSAIVMVHGVSAPPAVTINGQPPDKPATYLPDYGTLVIRLPTPSLGPTRLRLTKP